MPSCVLKDCTNHSRKSNKSLGVTFHRFLQEYHPNKEKWIKFVQKNRNEETWLPGEHAYLCSLHFRDEDKYTTKTGRTYLKKSAVPYDFKNIIKHEQSEICEPISEPVSDSESIFDTAQEILLKNQLQMETTARMSLKAKFKKVNRQNRYLKKKCESYKKLVTTLKEKLSYYSQAEIKLNIPQSYSLAEQTGKAQETE